MLLQQEIHIDPWRDVTLQLLSCYYEKTLLLREKRNYYEISLMRIKASDSTKKQMFITYYEKNIT